MGDPRQIFFYAFLTIFAVVTWAQIFRRPLMKKLAPRMFLYATGLVLAYVLLISYLQFRVFLGGPLELVLGTMDGFRWFLGYVRLHYANEYLISLPVAIFFALIARHFNKKYHGRFFENEELFLIALGILLVGYPGFFFYIPLVLVSSAIISLFSMPKGERLPLYHFWAPMGFLSLAFIHFFAANQSWWGNFRF